MKKLLIITIIFFILIIFPIFSKPNIKVMSGLSSWVRCVAFSPDSKFAATGTDNLMLNVWDIYRGKLIFSIKAHDNFITSVRFSKDGKYILTGSLDNTIKLWDLYNKEVIRTFHVKNRVYSSDISPDFKYAVSGNSDSNIYIFEIESGNLIKKIDAHNNLVSSIKFSESGKYLVSSSWDGSFKLCDIESGKELKKYIESKVRMTCSDISKDENLVASAGQDKILRVWNRESGELIIEFTGHTDEITSVSFSPDTKMIISGSNDGKIKLWDIKNKKLIKTFEGHENDIMCSDYSPDGKFFISGGIDRLMKLWDIEKKECIYTSISDDKKNYLTWTPDGYFYGTEFAIKKFVQIVDGEKYYLLDQFFEYFFKPDIITSRVMGIEEENKDQKKYLEQIQNPPLVDLYVKLKDGTYSNDADKIKNNMGIDNDSVQIKVKAKNEGGGVKQIRVYHNGKLYEEIINEKNNKDFEADYKIDLAKNNNFKVIGLSNDNVESKGKELIIKNEIKTNYEPKVYIFGIGIKDYNNEKLNLKYSVFDIIEIVKNTKNITGKLFKDIETITIYDSDASKENIDIIFKDLIIRIKPDDIFIFYFSGHGYTSPKINNEFLFLLSNNTFMAGTELLTYLRFIKATKQIVSIDSCFSGALTENIILSESLEDSSLAHLSRKSGFAVYASTSSKNLSIESSIINHGIYSYTMLEGFKGNAINDNNCYSVESMKYFLENTLPINSMKLLKILQFPVTYNFGNDFIFGMK